MAKDLGIGIIGLGMGAAIFDVHADPNSRLRVAAVCDTDPQRLEAAAREHPSVDYTSDYVDLVTAPGVDLVGVFSPDHLHHEHIMAALAAGKHVVTAKPLADSAAKAVEIAEDVDRRSLKLLAAQTCRWMPRFAAAQSLLASGDLGDLRVAESHYIHDMRPVLDRTPWRYEVPQDYVYGGLIHALDLLRWTGGDITHVHALGHNSGLDPRYDGLPDNIVVTIGFASGAIGRAAALCGVVDPHVPTVGLSLFGTRGTLVDGRVVLDRVAGRPAMTIESPADADGHHTEMHSLLRHFEDCVTNDGQPLVDHWDAARTVAVCAAVHDSLRTGLPARVKKVGRR